jgi:hypothetical protein
MFRLMTSQAVFPDLVSGLSVRRSERISAVVAATMWDVVLFNSHSSYNCYLSELDKIQSYFVT